MTTSTSAAESSLPRSRRVLLLVDFINPLDFPEGELLAESAAAAAAATARLKAEPSKTGVPTIYANDNYGLQQSDFWSLVKLCQAKRGAAGLMAKRLRPVRKDLTILKPKHSAFRGSPLDAMLKQIGVKKIILAGLSTDRCVLMTAIDAYMRDYRVWVPSDCTAAESRAFHLDALAYMARVMKTDKIAQQWWAAI